MITQTFWLLKIIGPNYLEAVYMSRASPANQAELCHENLSSTQKDHLNELYAVVAVIRILLSELAPLTRLAQLI